MADSSKFRILGETPKAVSRRRFIKGVIAGGAAVSSATYLFRASTVHGVGGSERLLTLNVNGQHRRADVMKQETLAWTLRYKLGLTGTKLGCDRAECAACTVLIGDVPHYSCSVLTHTMRDQKVLTLVGFGFVLRNPSVAITKPDIQKAHWNPCSSMMPSGAEVLGVPWEKCDVVWGDTSNHLPFTCVSGGSQTTHAMTRAARAAAMDARQKLQEIAAKSLGGRSEDYTVANERVLRNGSSGMTLAQAARCAIELGGKL
jgi:hypothetical protein